MSTFKEYMEKPLTENCGPGTMKDGIPKKPEGTYTETDACETVPGIKKLSPKEKIQMLLKKGQAKPSDDAVNAHPVDMKKTKVSEDIEQIDELSKDTMKSYYKKATDNAVSRIIDAGITKSGTPEADSHIKAQKEKAVKRMGNLVKVNKRLDEDQLDEISRPTLRSYIVKSTLSSTDAARKQGMEYGRGDFSNAEKHTDTLKKRIKGTVAATWKLGDKKYGDKKPVSEADESRTYDPTEYKKPIHYRILDHKTHTLTNHKPHKTGPGATRTAEKLNMEYGAHRYSRKAIYEEEQLDELSHQKLMDTSVKAISFNHDKPRPKLLAGIKKRLADPNYESNRNLRKNRPVSENYHPSMIDPYSIYTVNPANGNVYSKHYSHSDALAKINKKGMNGKLKIVSGRQLRIDHGIDKPQK